MNKYLSIDCILSFIHIFFAKVEYFSCFVYNYFFLAEIFLVFYTVFISIQVHTGIMQFSDFVFTKTTKNCIKK